MTYNKHKENKILQRNSLEVSINRRRSEIVFSLQYVLCVAGRLKFKARPWGRLRDPVQAPSKCTAAFCSLPCFVTRIYLHTLRKINSRNLVVMKPRLTVLFFWNPKKRLCTFWFLTLHICLKEMLSENDNVALLSLLHFTRGCIATFKSRRRHILQIGSGPTQPATALKLDAYQIVTSK
jgi:hypothetical protein